MHVCVVSFKECWQDDSGRWLSTGGFPLQMTAIASLFRETTLVVCRGRPQAGGIPLPVVARVVPLRVPTGADLRRKVSVLAGAPYYLGAITRAIWRADVVHVPLPGDIPLLCMMLALMMRKRLIARYGGSWTSNARTTLMNRVTRLCMRTFAGGRNLMLATGADDEAPPAPGVGWIFSTSLSRREVAAIGASVARSLADPPNVIYAGRLSPEKGVMQLVEAVAALRAEGFTPLPSVTLAGDGPERGTLERRVAELGCGDMISFSGQLDRPRLSNVLSRADLCVQPSLTEGFSKAWLDAFAHGVPVLSSDVGAASAVIGRKGERGWLVPPGDVPALSSTLRRVLGGSVNWQAVRERCRVYAERYTLEAWAQEIGDRCARQWHAKMVDGRLVTS
jgi:glycosyltransferase involved in cell wall biosynthesis